MRDQLRARARASVREREKEMEMASQPVSAQGRVSSLQREFPVTHLSCWRTPYLSSMSWYREALLHLPVDSSMGLALSPGAVQRSFLLEVAPQRCGAEMGPPESNGLIMSDGASGVS